MCEREESSRRAREPAEGQEKGEEAPSPSRQLLAAAQVELDALRAMLGLPVRPPRPEPEEPKP